MKPTLHGQNICFGTYTSLLLILLTCLALLVTTPFAVAQAPAFVFPVSVQVTQQSLPVPVTITSAGAFDHAQVLTQGSSGQEFKGNVVCSGTTCTATVSFLPKYPGLRIGAVLLFDRGNNLIGSRNLSGVGTGSLSVMSPGKINTLAGDGCPIDGPCPTNGPTPATAGLGLKLPSGAATDAAGNLYISDTENSRILE